MFSKAQTRRAKLENKSRVNSLGIRMEKGDTPCLSSSYPRSSQKRSGLGDRGCGRRIHNRDRFHCFGIVGGDYSLNCNGTGTGIYILNATANVNVN